MHEHWCKQLADKAWVGFCTVSCKPATLARECKGALPPVVRMVQAGIMDMFRRLRTVLFAMALFVARGAGQHRCSGAENPGNWSPGIQVRKMSCSSKS